MMEQLKAALQAEFTDDWASELLAGLQALASVSGGNAKQLAVAGETLDLRGLWPKTLTVGAAPVASAELWPQVTATAVLDALPQAGKPVEKTLRKLLRTYTTALRDPSCLPAALFSRWPLVRALYNHFQAQAALMHQLHLDADSDPLEVTLFGPLANETMALLKSAGITVVQRPMKKPWQRAFSPDAHMQALTITQGRQRVGKAEAGLGADVLQRAKALKQRHWQKTAAPAFTKQPPILRPLASRPDAYTVFDLEFSSGSKLEGQFVTEIGALKVRANKIVDTFDCFVQIPHGMRLNYRSQALTGIHAGLLSRFGRPATTALSEFQNFIGKDPLLGFAVKGGDLLVMQRQFGLYATPNRLLDVAAIAKAGGPMPGSPDVGLAKYRNYLGMDILAHGAVYDAVTTYALYAYLQGTPLAPEAVVAQFNRVFAQTSFKPSRR